MTAPPQRSRQFYYVLRALVMRELKGRYRRSVLGPFWVVLQPLLLLALFMLIRTILSVDMGDKPYVLVAYSAIVPWTFFANCMTRSTESVYANSALVKKMNLPRQVFPLSMCIVSLVDGAIALAILFVIVFFFEPALSVHLLWLPALVAVVTALGAGMALFTSAIGTYRRDMGFLLGPGVQFWMFASPVMYPLSKVPEQHLILYKLNPMVGVIEGFRNVLVYHAAPDPAMLIYAVVFAAIVWAVSWPTFTFVSQYFADVL